MNKLYFCRLPVMLFLLMILFSCLMPGSSPPGITVPPPDSESITLTGETLNDGFAVQNSDTIIFGFERITGLGIGNSDGDSEISINLPAGISTFSVTKDGAEGCVDGLTDTTGSFIIVSTSNPGALTILDFGEAEGTSLFIFTIEAAAALPLWSCDWIVNPSTNVDIRFIRTIPDISINCPSSVLSGTAGIILDAGESEVSYEGTITPVPSITSYAWTQTAGPAVTLNGEDTAILTFNAPVVATDTDLTFQLTVTDDAGLTAEKEIILSVLAPDYESITLLGETLNDGFTIDNSDTILFGFERVTGLGVNNREGDTEIAIILPTGVCKYSILKDGVICEVDGITDSSGSLIVANTSNPGSILIMDFGESEGTSFFAATIEAAAAVPVGSCDWQVRPLTDTNADIRFVRAIPDISIDFPSTVLSGAAGVILNADESKVSYAGTITPAPSISSFSWTQTAGPAVTLNGTDTAAPSFNAPVVAADTDLTFQLTATDDAGLTATETITVTVMVPGSESITMLGETLNDGFTIQNSNPIMFGFNREMASSDSEISIHLPAGVSTFSVTKDGAPGQVDGLTDTTGSLIMVSDSNPGSLTIFDLFEASGISLFVVTITAPTVLPLGSCDWIMNPSTNVDIQFVRAIPDISINCPATVLSGTADFIINASETRISFEGTITPVPSITSYAWTQTAGPAVTLNGEDTAILTFDAPVVATDTDLTFQLTVTDDAGLAATETVTVTVLAP